MVPQRANTAGGNHRPAPARGQRLLPLPLRRRSARASTLAGSVPPAYAAAMPAHRLPHPGCLSLRFAMHAAYQAVGWRQEKLLCQWGMVLFCSVQVLLDASWRPAVPGTFPDRPSSPGRSASAGLPQAGSAASAAAPKGSYLPPQLRDQPGRAPMCSFCTAWGLQACCKAWQGGLRSLAVAVRVI